MTSTSASSESVSPSDAVDQRPSLTNRSGTRPTGLLASIAWWLTRVLEPVGYTAALTIGLGLWALLDDHVVALPDVSSVVLLTGSAAALWWAAHQIGRLHFAETWRLGNATYSAAVGTTAWLAWVTTDGALVPEVRLTITAFIVAMLAYGVQRVRGDLLTYCLLLAGVVATSVLAAATISEAAGLHTEGAIVVGALTSASVAYVIAGRSNTTTRRDATNFAIILGSGAVLVAAFALPDAWRLAAAASGFVAAASAYWASRPTPRSGLIAAISSASLAALLALSWLPWSRIIESIPEPVLMVVAGSAALMALAWATRRVLSFSRPSADGST